VKSIDLIRRSAQFSDIRAQITSVFLSNSYLWYCYIAWVVWVKRSLCWRLHATCMRPA